MTEKIIQKSIKRPAALKAKIATVGSKVPASKSRLLKEAVQARTLRKKEDK